MGVKGAQSPILSICTPTPNPTPTPTSSPNSNPHPTPSPNPNPSSNPSPHPNPRLWSQILLGSKMGSNDWAKAATNEVWGILFSLMNMAGMAEPARCKG